MKITLKKSPAQGTASEALTIAAKPSTEAPAERSEPVAPASAEADAVASSGPDVAAGAAVMARPQGKAQRITSVVFASLGIVAVLLFVVLIGLQLSESAFFSKPDSLWLK